MLSLLGPLISYLESGYTVLDHLHVEAVIVNCVVRDDHCPPTVLLHHPGLGEEGAAPGRGGDETKGKAGS